MLVQDTYSIGRKLKRKLASWWPIQHPPSPYPMAKLGMKPLVSMAKQKVTMMEGTPQPYAAYRGKYRPAPLHVEVFNCDVTLMRCILLALSQFKNL